MNREQWVSFGFGVLAGAVAGGVAALLYAPKSGKEIRSGIKEKTGQVLEGSKNKIGDFRHLLGEKVSGEECQKTPAIAGKGD